MKNPKQDTAKKKSAEKPKPPTKEEAIKLPPRTKSPNMGFHGRDDEKTLNPEE